MDEPNVNELSTASYDQHSNEAKKVANVLRTSYF